MIQCIDEDLFSLYVSTITYLRPMPSFQKTFMRIFPISKKFLKKMREGIQQGKIKREDPGIVKEWLQSAKDDLKISESSYNMGIYGLTLYHLQQTVEKVIKAQAMMWGLIKESELLTQYGHKSAKFYVKLSSNPFLKELLEEFLPWVDEVGGVLVSKRERMEVKKIFQEEKTSDGIKLLEKYAKANDKKELIDLDKGFHYWLKCSGKLLPYSFASSKELLFDLMEDLINKKFQRAEIKKLIKRGIDLDNSINSSICLFLMAWWSGFLLFPLSIITPIYESAGRYPDEKRKSNIDYSESSLIKDFGSLKFLLNEYIENFSEILDC
ncbi:MAG: HEPN domain protein [Candidatus Methanolliviera sp. GoM_oil]|nr:MAG: HEPN domain protein [Candidatus Methanolliviera sp. GoM_oil]